MPGRQIMKKEAPRPGADPGASASAGDPTTASAWRTSFSVMTGNDEDHPGTARILAGIESLHARLDAFEAAGRRELGEAGGLAVRSVPAWRRRTAGEARSAHRQYSADSVNCSYPAAFERRLPPHAANIPRRKGRPAALPGATPLRAISGALGHRS